MVLDGKQILLTNEFDKRKGFYKVIHVEGGIRALTVNHPNLYWIVVFACCRELFKPKTHCGGISFEDALAMGRKDLVDKLIIDGEVEELKDPDEVEPKEQQDGRGAGDYKNVDN